MKSLIFVSGNKHKYEEVKAIAEEFGIEIIFKPLQLEEKGTKIEEIACNKAFFAYERIKKNLFVEDTGIYFKAYNNFPGYMPKRIFEMLGYKGLLALIKAARTKKAYFKTVVAFTDGKMCKIFEGTLEGRLTEKIYGKNKDVMPYERIFVPEKYKKALALISREEKNKFSHRAKALRKFFDWYSNNFL